MQYTLNCEFNGYKGPLLTMALIREDGKSIYLGYPFCGPGGYDEWVEANVIPVINSAQINILRGDWIVNAKRLETFFKGDAEPHIITDWPDDVKYFCEAIITGPGEMIDIPSISFEVVRVDAYPTELEGAVRHNAWWDAAALWAVLAKQGAAQ